MKKLKIHLYYTWNLYLIALIFILAAVYFARDLIVRPADTEQVRICVLGPGVQTGELEDALAEALPGRTSQNISDISVSSTSFSQLDKDSVLFSVANEADLIIAREDQITPEIASFYFYTDFDRSDFSDSRIYTVEGDACGVYLDGERFQGSCSEEGDYILFFGYKSPNLGGLNERSESENDAALEAAKWLME